MAKKIVFLDRDGVINKLVERDGRLVSPRSFDDFEILPGVPLAIRILRDAGYQVVVVTNQPDISRGLMSLEELELMHSLVSALGVNQICVCPHSDEDHCTCRKPKPGLLAEYLEGVDEFVSELWMVGDMQSDLEAGRSVQARVVMISAHRTYPGSDAQKIEESLLDAVMYITA